ncbi:Fe-S cluster assembly protein HesB [Methylacidiphilum kamchatkense Kam1]|uniref:Fe-S cluster assembly protein HesB n=1 Tax=Methylacidiphilum kamchatkense Kam1 TaxID=1202785 RepID=A0A0C1USN3_9BACT|nr:iron-sulfur cluster assembly accessory protein [Methylacidiphilum kamchatkense]KIE58783.1 Fe-S cluster assembly protein HesB [Methylacidiphilum kamchatkense Kam1]QDQ41810.1 iron-sulfur cluster assembly protein/iron-sulfur cluster insertion protein [Methylacidiphilum kamchatkense Kam1]
MNSTFPLQLNINLTPMALSKIKKLTDSHPGYMLRLSVTKGGCAGNEYLLELAIPKEKDIRLKIEDVVVAIDPESSHLLAGSTIDYKEGLTQGGFRIINPQAKSTCGCGSSFQV